MRSFSLGAWLFLAPYLMIGNLLVLNAAGFAERMLYFSATGFCLLVGLVVDRVISSSQSGGAALFGVDAVKGAMSEGRVRELVLPHPIDAEIFDALVVDAARRSTPVEFVTGPAAEKLEQEGGLGAVLHYAA